MLLRFDHDQFGRLVATLADGDRSAVVTASDGAEAAADLAGAFDSLRNSGTGESFWLEAQGEYRWLFRRRDDRLHIVVLWCSGVVTGWEHVFEAECDLASFVDRSLAALRSVQAASA